MTFIKPDKENNLINRLLFILGVCLVSSALTLIVAYNWSVNLNYGVSKVSSEIKGIQTQNAELKEKIFAQFDNQKLEVLALRRGLVKERNPEFLEVTPHVGGVALVDAGSVR